MLQIDWKKDGSRSEILIYPLYIVGSTQLADNDWCNKPIKHSHTYISTHTYTQARIHIYTYMIKHTYVHAFTYKHHPHITYINIKTLPHMYAYMYTHAQKEIMLHIYIYLFACRNVHMNRHPLYSSRKCMHKWICEHPYMLT